MNALARLILVALLPTTLFADITTSVNILGPGEGTQPPPGRLIIDIFVDVTPGDEWTATGLRAQAVNGARFVYLQDPNDGQPIVLNPGAENRFVTSFSRPRARDGNGRFNNCQAFTAGGYCPALPPPGLFTSSELNVAWAGVPSGNGIDGYVGRIALDTYRACNVGGIFGIYTPGQEPPFAWPVLLAEICLPPGGRPTPGVASASHQDPTPVGINWGVYSQDWPPHTCRADFDCNGQVGLSDLTILLESFGSCWPATEFDSRADMVVNSCVDMADLTAFLAEFGNRDYPFEDCF